MTTQPARHCGKCQLCCELIEVKPLEKPEWQRCKFQGTRGCSIYPTRPDCCRAFKCGWLEGALPRELRPDKVGAVFWSTQMLTVNGANFDIVSVSVRPGRIHPAVMAIAMRVSHNVAVTIKQGEVATLYVDGQRIVSWKPETEFFGYDLVEGRIANIRVVPQSEALEDAEKAAAWERVQRESVKVAETGEYAGKEWP